MADYIPSKRKDHIDNDGNKLKRGFYTSPLVYFTGNYSEKGVPIFDNEHII